MRFGTEARRRSCVRPNEENAKSSEYVRCIDPAAIRNGRGVPSHEIKRSSDMAKVICVLYDDPVDGFPKSYAREGIPKISHYPGGQTLPTPKAIDFKPGTLLGSVSGELGLRKYLESNGHTLIVTSDKDGPDSVLERELPDAEIVISQPFWPAYLTAAR